MSFKFHLLAIMAIAFFVIFASQFFEQKPVEVPAPQVSPYNITVVRASWGLECNGQEGLASNAVSENNVRDKVSALCNGKTECLIPVDSRVLGNDPAPKCYNKQLSVDYRCFAFDRLQSIKSQGGDLVVKCEQPSPGNVQ